jgi:hypothetical protein
LQLATNLAALWVLMVCIEPLLHVQGFRSGTASAPAVLTLANWLGIAALGVSYLGLGWLFGKHVLRSGGISPFTRTRRGVTLLAVPLLAMLVATVGCFVAIAHIALWPVPVAGLMANLVVFVWLYR